MALYPFWFFQGCYYDYGYPSGNVPEEPDVLAQWIMEPNGSNQLVDVVQGITLSENGSPVYGSDWGKPYRCLNPWVSYAAGYHRGSLGTELDDPTGTASYTVEAWVRGTDFYSDNRPIVAVYKENLYGNTASLFLFGSPGNGGGTESGPPSLAFFVIKNGGLFGGGGNMFAFLHQSDFDLNDGEEHHIRAVYDPNDPYAYPDLSGSNTKIYIDGVDYGTVGGRSLTFPNRPMTDWETVEIGGINTDGATQQYNPNEIAEVRISKNGTNNSYP